MRYALLFAGALVAGVMPASAATTENFQVKTTADLIDLCSADPASDPAWLLVRSFWPMRIEALGIAASNGFQLDR